MMLKRERFELQKSVVIILALACLSGCGLNSMSSVSSEPTLAQPRVVQTGRSPTNWETFNTPASGSFRGHSTVGPDRQIWMSSGGNVYRFHVTSGQVDIFSGIDTNFGVITTGPDDNIWTCGADQLTKITVQGVETVYPVSERQCTSIAVGSDGALWYDASGGVIRRFTVDGSYSDITLPRPEFAADVIAGNDGNIWFTEYGNHRFGGYEAIANLDINSHVITEFRKTLPNHNDHFDLLFEDSNGSFYASDDFDDIWRLKPDGTWSKFSIGLGPPLKPGDPRRLYFAGATDASTWSFSSHKVTTLGLPPDTSGFPAYAALIGPDLNYWFWSGATASVYINRVLSVAPASATISVGQSQPFAITETKCNCVWSAESSNPSIATVSGVSGGRFTVTAVDSGSATVTVADKKQNTFPVLITVP